jgi:UPF0042 nucleotide-binding protein
MPPSGEAASREGASNAPAPGELPSRDTDTIAPERQCNHRLVIVTGLSGAGKASTLRALEDVGFEAVDNPPFTMLRELMARAATDVGARLAIGVDARMRGFDQDAIRETLAGSRDRGDLGTEVIFLWAEDAVLQRRFSETRRRHPLANSGRVQDGIDAERRLTAELREIADWVIDTSDMSPQQLRHHIEARYVPRMRTVEAAMSISLMSFAYPAGLPREADMVFDVRFLRNPHYVLGLRSLTGLDEGVGRYIDQDPDFSVVFARILDLLQWLLPRFVREGKKYFTLAIGCTGGRHRSVYVVERLGHALRATGWSVAVRHRDVTGLAAAQPAPGAGAREVQHV